MQNKETLRQYFRSIQSSRCNSGELPAAEKSVIQNAQALIDSSRCGIIGIYIPMQGEPDILSLVRNNPHIEFLLPKVVEQKMEFVCYNYGDRVQVSKKLPLLKEPISDQIMTPDMLFVPGLAFDLRGYRLGLGKGHYDKYLAARQHVQRIGVCFNSNLIEFLPEEDHDYRMQFIITEYLTLRL